MTVPTCRLGGECDLDPRAEFLLGRPGIAQCRRCSTVYEATEWQPRSCVSCDRQWGESLHDPCVGMRDDVYEACCGHGNPDDAYVSFRDERGRIEGHDALDALGL